MDTDVQISCLKTLFAYNPGPQVLCSTDHQSGKIMPQTYTHY